MDVTIAPKKLCGEVRAISSKSDVHRLLIAAALADTETEIACNTISEDIKATMDCLCALGAKIDVDADKITVSPIKEAPKKATLNCRESGSTLRFLLPVAAALGVEATFSGSGRLPNRPIIPLRREMEENGVTFTPPWKFPIEISGQLQPGEYRLQGNVSSQFVTGLLFALPLLEGDSTIYLVPPVESKPYIHMTIHTLEQFGIQIEEQDNLYSIKGNQKYISPKEIAAEGDWSNAAFFLTAGVLGEKISVTGLSQESLQGDKQIVDILQKMGGHITIENDVVTAEPSTLHGITIDAKDIPDLVPILAVAAAGAQSGMTTITHAERLRLKESDRLASICESLTNLGAVIAEMDDGLVIWTGDGVRGGNVFSFNDHRIVMAMSIASVITREKVEIRSAEAVEKSYPQFFSDFKALGGDVDGIHTEG